mmetsp:Transcript_8594/g.20658  ORF Transcript_8594/g.20658 Transcript_8594/m.20658 type:complete len:116 (+) Transcript_8594:4222-4569(+)
METLVPIYETRVFVALARGLWDHAASRLSRTVNDLQATPKDAKGQESKAPPTPWRVHQNAGAALSCLDGTFKQFLSGVLGSELRPHDLDLPQSSQAAHKLLSRERSGVDTSYSVF